MIFMAEGAGGSNADTSPKAAKHGPHSPRLTELLSPRGDRQMLLCSPARREAS